MANKEPMDLTRTYRPTKDWNTPLEKILESLPPAALEIPLYRYEPQSSTSFAITISISAGGLCNEPCKERKAR